MTLSVLAERISLTTTLNVCVLSESAGVPWTECGRSTTGEHGTGFQTSNISQNCSRESVSKRMQVHTLTIKHAHKGSSSRTSSLDRPPHSATHKHRHICTLPHRSTHNYALFFESSVRLVHMRAHVCAHALSLARSPTTPHLSVAVSSILGGASIFPHLFLFYFLSHCLSPQCVFLLSPYFFCAHALAGALVTSCSLALSLSPPPSLSFFLSLSLSHTRSLSLSFLRSLSLSISLSLSLSFLLFHSLYCSLSLSRSVSFSLLSHLLSCS